MAPPSVLIEVPNSGVPRTESDGMTYQCIWISILDYYEATGEKIIDNDNEVTTVQELKKYAECDGKCNGDNEYTDVLPGKITIDDQEYVHTIKSLERHYKDWRENLVRQFQYFQQTSTDKLDISGLTVNNGKIPKRDGFYEQYELSGEDGYKEEVNNQIWIVYGYDHFQLVTEYKNPDKGIEYNINVVGDRTNIAQYYDEIPGYNKDGTNIEYR